MSTTLNALTKGEFKSLLDDYFAPPSKRQKMSLDEINKLAVALNSKINIPFINEGKEERILVKIVLKMDTFLYDHIPNELYDLIRNSTTGLDEKDSKMLIKRLTKIANDKIDIPYLTESMERIAIRFVISALINATRKLLDFDKVTARMSEVKISSNKNLNTQQMDQLFLA